MHKYVFIFYSCNLNCKSHFIFLTWFLPGRSKFLIIILVFPLAMLISNVTKSNIKNRLYSTFSFTSAFIHYRFKPGRFVLIPIMKMRRRYEKRGNWKVKKMVNFLVEEAMTGFIYLNSWLLEIWHRLCWIISIDPSNWGYM